MSLGQWEPLGTWTAASGVTATLAFQIPAPTFAATATVESPGLVTATAAFEIPAPQFRKPEYTAEFVGTIKRQNFTGALK